MGQLFSWFTRSLTLTGLGGEDDPSTQNRFSPYERGLFNRFNRSRCRRSPRILEQFSYDFEMKTRKQNRNNKRTELGRFDWFIERMQTRVAFGWLSERSGEKTSSPRTF